jgi:hypothetical protein
VVGGAGTIFEDSCDPADPKELLLMGFGLWLLISPFR